jgi:trans-aconitate 2-methyltransferase
MSSQVEQFYNVFAKEQMKAGVHRRHICIFQWLQKFGLKSDHRVLEIGCGIGTVTGLVAAFLKRGVIVANDISPESILIAKRRLKGYANIEFVEGDVMSSVISGDFDFVFLPDVLEHIPISQHRVLFMRIAELLKPGGKVFIHMPEPHFQDWAQIHEKHLMQIIDQSVHLNEILKNLEGTPLRLDFLCNYSIWLEDPDYQALLLKKATLPFTYLPKNFSNGIISRISDKIFRRLGRPKRLIPF